MRTAIVSDLHLGLPSRLDVLGDEAIRAILFEEIGAADRVVLLGDVVELRARSLGDAMAAARPFFEELGDALGDREVILVPGNHDHRFAEPLLDRASMSGGSTLELENRYETTPGPTAQIDDWLGDARLELAYPGVWLRDDVYATHGHYMDCHLTLPRVECIAAATMLRVAERLPDPATPDDYERILRPIYGLAFGLAQAPPSSLRRATGQTSEVAWKLLTESRNGRRPARRLAGTVARAGAPLAAWTLNRALGSSFQFDLSLAAITDSGIAAATETATRLCVDAAHVLTGHTHRAGPCPGEQPWPLPGGGRLYNTGNWVISIALQGGDGRPGPYWPGTVTWLEDSGEPSQTQLLDDRPREQLLSRATRR